jgi:hypothetical protein
MFCRLQVLLLARPRERASKAKRSASRAPAAERSAAALDL